jgi:hypothetical protein
VTKLESMVGKRVKIISSFGGYVNNYIGNVGTISSVRADKSRTFRLLVKFTINGIIRHGLIPMHEDELRYLNNRKVTLD